MTELILTKTSTENEIRAYFTKVLELTKSGEEFTVDLEMVWPLAYGRKEEAVRVLKKDFIQDVDYKRIENNIYKINGGRPTYNYLLSIDCVKLFEQKAITKKKIKKADITYIFYDKNNNAIKIGRTSDILDRQRGIRTSNPFCKLIAIKNEDIEKELHVSYKHLNITLEWFKADENIIKEIITKYNFKQLIKF